MSLRPPLCHNSGDRLQRVLAVGAQTPFPYRPKAASDTPIHGFVINGTLYTRDESVSVAILNVIKQGETMIQGLLWAAYGPVARNVDGREFTASGGGFNISLRYDVKYASQQGEISTAIPRITASTEGGKKFGVTTMKLVSDERVINLS